MRKLWKIFLCLVLAAVMLCGFAACQQKPDTLKDELIGSLEKVANETQNFEITMAIPQKDTNVVAAKILGYGTQDSITADIYMQQGFMLNVVVLRNNAAYATTLETQNVIALENLQAEVEKLAYNNPDVIFSKQAENILDGILGGSSIDISGILEYVSEENLAKFAEIGETLSRNVLSLLFNKVEQTDDGYVLSIDLEKLFEDLWNKVYAVANTIDNHNRITVSELYASKPAQEILSLFLDDVTGKQVEDVLKYVSEIPEVTLPFEILAANEKESAIDYIGRYLEIIKIDGTVTVGSMRVSDIISSSNNGKMFDLTDELDKIKPQFDMQIQPLVGHNFAFELRFDKNQKLVGVKIDVPNTSETFMQYDRVTLEVKLLDKQPQLLDATKLNSIATSNVKVTKCQENLFWEYDFTDYTQKYYTLKDGDLSATIYADPESENSLSVFVQKGMDPAFQIDLYQEDGQWTVDPWAPYLDFDGDLYIEADCATSGNNILVYCALVDENDTKVCEFNFDVSFGPISH